MADPTQMLGPGLRPTAFEVASSPLVVKLALRTSLFVGSLLNVINQGDALFGNGELHILKLGLTYLVPYCVATYTATTVVLRRHDAPPAANR